MGTFFKGIAKGFLYVFFLPFGLLAIVLYALFGILVFIIQFIKLIYLFFTGRNLQSDLKEDIEVKQIILKSQGGEVKETSASLYDDQSIVYGTGYVSPSFSDKQDESQKTIRVEPIDGDNRDA